MLSDTQAAKALIAKGLVTQEEVRKCLVLKEKLARKDQRKSLVEILVSQNCLTATQAQRVIKAETEAVNIAQIPGYHILQRLGQGSMGVVYKAKQLSMDRIVAIKVLLKQLAMNKEFITRFQREARLAAKLNNSHVVQGIDVGETQGYHYFVMEYVEGTSVKEELDTGKVFEEDEALDVVLQVADAMQHAHERGLVHRDIKPDNIIKTTAGIVKLADLGLARQVSDQKAAITEAGVAVGTPYYISPEQIRGEIDIDIRTDIYSLGATFYHMVTGKVPFEGDNPTVVMRRHLKDTLVPPDHVNTNLSNGLGEVVETMMAKDVAFRYAGPKDLIMDLESLKRGEPPLIARERLAQDTLKGLAAGTVDEAAEELGASQAAATASTGALPADDLRTFLLVATVSLALLNLLQLLL